MARIASKSSTKAKAEAKTARQTTGINVGGVKQQPKWKVGLIAFTAVLMLTAVGYIGLSAYKVNRLNAKAAGYKTVYHDAAAGYMIRACKIYTAYGYLVRTVSNKPAYTSPSAWLIVGTFEPVDRNVPPGTIVPLSTPVKQISGNASQSWWGNTVTIVDAAAGSGSNYFKVAYFGTPGALRQTSYIPVDTLPGC